MRSLRVRAEQFFGARCPGGLRWILPARRAADPYHVPHFLSDRGGAALFPGTKVLMKAEENSGSAKEVLKHHPVRGDDG